MDVMGSLINNQNMNFESSHSRLDSKLWRTFDLAFRLIYVIRKKIMAKGFTPNDVANIPIQLSNQSEHKRFNIFNISQQRVHYSSLGTLSS